MSYQYSKDYKKNDSETLETPAIIAATSIQGTNVLWDITTVGAGGYTVTVLPFVKEQFADHFECDKPCLKIRCSADCSANNVIISYPSNGSTATYTFSTNCSVIPKYLVLSTNRMSTDYSL